MKNFKKLFGIVLFFFIFSASYSFSVIITDSIDHVSAPNGSILIYVNLLDTDTSDSYISSLKILDKKNIVLFDGQLSERYNWLSDFDGKTAIFTNNEEDKIASYKLKGKSFDLVRELQIPNLSRAEVVGKIVYVFTYSDSNYGLMAYNKTLSKKLFEIPASNKEIFDVFPNGVVAQLVISAGSKVITYTKKGKPYSTFNISFQNGYYLNIEVDQYGGLLYWLNIGITNLPVSYLNKKGKKITDNFQLDSEVGVHWSALAWNGKNLYVGNSDNTKIYAFKIGKKSALLNSIEEAPIFSCVVLDKSKVFIINYASTYHNYVSNYDKNLKSLKWKSDDFDDINYIGNGVCEGRVDDQSAVLLTIFKSDKKTIATHTYHIN